MREDVEVGDKMFKLLLAKALNLCFDTNRDLKRKRKYWKAK